VLCPIEGKLRLLIFYFVQLNWHVIWQATIVVVIAWGLAVTLRETEKEDYSFPRTTIWTIAALSPLLIAPFTAIAAYFNWRHYEALLVWQWLIPKGGIATTAIRSVTAPDVGDRGLYVLGGVYFGWLCVYGFGLSGDIVLRTLWLRRNRAQNYNWTGEQRRDFRGTLYSL